MDSHLSLCWGYVSAGYLQAVFDLAAPGAPVSQPQLDTYSAAKHRGPGVCSRDRRVDHYEDPGSRRGARSGGAVFGRFLGSGGNDTSVQGIIGTLRQLPTSIAPP